MNQIRFIKLPVTLKKRGVSRSLLYYEIANGLYPRRVKVGKRAAVDIEEEADAINRARAAGKTDDEIRALVRQLEEARLVGADAAAPELA